MNPEHMKFQSRLTSPASVEKASIEYMEDGREMIATYAGTITISPETPVEVWECECGKHPCVSFWHQLSDGRPALVSANLPNGASAVRFSAFPNR